MSTSRVIASEVDAPPSALATMAGAMVAVLAPIRDADDLDRECMGLAAHAEASAAAEARFAADRAALERALGRRFALPGSLDATPPLPKAQTSNKGENPMSDAFTTGMRRASVTVPLSAPVLWFDKKITEIVLVEPTARDFFELGDVSTVVHSVGGQGATVVELNDTVLRYLARCAQVEQADVLITQIGLRDGQALKRAIVGFFRPATEDSSG